MAKVTSHNGIILYILCMCIVHKSTPYAPSSNMRILSYILLQHAFSQASSWHVVQYASSLLLLCYKHQAGSCSAIYIRLAQCFASDINMAQCCIKQQYSSMLCIRHRYGSIWLNICPNAAHQELKWLNVVASCINNNYGSMLCIHGSMLFIMHQYGSCIHGSMMCIRHQYGLMLCIMQASIWLDNMAQYCASGINYNSILCIRHQLWLCIIIQHGSMLCIHSSVVWRHRHGLMLCIRHHYGTVWLNAVQASIYSPMQCCVSGITIWLKPVHHESEWPDVVHP